MDLAERIQNLSNLQYAISTGESVAIQELKDLYFLALGKTMKRECSSCRIRAYQELINITDIKLQNMATQKYTFKDKEALVYFGHEHFTSENLTDEVALEMVKSNPANADLFNGSFDLEDSKKSKQKAD